MNRSVPTLCAIAVALSGLGACNQAPSKASASSQTLAPASVAALQEPPVPGTGRTDAQAAAMRDAYILWVENKAYPAGLRRPVFPDPRRTDRAARIQGAKYALWRVADAEISDKAALKAMDKQMGLDTRTPKGTYGRMAEGLPGRAAG